MGRELFSIASGRRVVVELESTGEDGSVNMRLPDDVTKAYKVDMGDHVHNITKEAGNKFFILPGSTDVSLTDSQGNPAQILTQAEDENTNSTQLQAVNSPQAVELFKATSRSGQLDLHGSPFLIKKGKGLSEDTTSDALFAEVNNQGSNAPFVIRVQQVLRENGQNNSDNPFISGDIKARENDSGIAISRIQRTLGEHGPRKFPSVVQGSQPEDIVSLRELKKLGMLTMLEASGELSIPQNPTGIEYLTTLAPGIARVGGKVPVSRFSAANVYKKANPNFEKPSSTSFIENDNILSYGNVNNYAATFSGPTSGPSIVSATLLMLTVGGLVKLFAVALQKSPVESGQQGETNEDRARRLGRFKKKEEDSVLGSLGFKVDLVDTDNDYMACVSKGVDVFFGLADATPGIGGFLTSVGGNITKIHGYYNVILRSIVRNAVNFFGPGITDLGTIGDSSAQSSDVESAVTDLALEYNPFALLEKLNSSPLLKFMNIIARIGDIAINTEQYESRVVETGLASIIDMIDEKDTIGEGLNPSILQGKNRLSSGKLAWRQSSIKSLYILPPGLLSAGYRFDGNKDGELLGGIAGNSTRTVGGVGNKVVISEEDKISNGNRIKASVVEEMENYLERDYMPFYFHDIRTNEIIAFHAFLDNVSDSFDADYNESEGFGRVDKVYTYKSTSRSVSLSFRLVALDPEDFDEMWMKVNKMVTLVYPQWSKGREISWGRNKMVQPFSQHPSASPLVRMRLGDLFKSNYTKFALARLFGISDQASEFALENVTQDDGSTSYSTQQRIVDQISLITANRQNKIYSPGDVLWIRANNTGNLHATGYPRVGANPAAGVGAVVGRVTGRNAPRDPGLILHYSTKANIIEATSADSTTFKVQLLQPGDGQTGTFSVAPNQTYPDVHDIQIQARRKVMGTTPQGTADTTSEQAMNSFLSETDNPVFKAFASTKGRGMAGFIKSIKFDYSETTWNVNTFNSRAPMMIKVDMEFAPVHDIPLGIDHNGFMTAPAYNTGKSMASLGYDRAPTNQEELFKNSVQKLDSFRNNRNTRGSFGLPR